MSGRGWLPNVNNDIVILLCLLAMCPPKWPPWDHNDNDSSPVELVHTLSVDALVGGAEVHLCLAPLAGEPVGTRALEVIDQVGAVGSQEARLLQTVVNLLVTQGSTPTSRALEKKTVNISLIPSSLSLIWGLIKKSFAPRFAPYDSYRICCLHFKIITSWRWIFPKKFLHYTDALVFLRLNNKPWGFS